MIIKSQVIAENNRYRILYERIVYGDGIGYEVVVDKNNKQIHRSKRMNRVSCRKYLHEKSRKYLTYGIQTRLSL